MAKIFVVEDELIVSLDIQQRIDYLGHEVAGSADNGDTAIKMVLETKPDLILMDINIKGKIDGIETSRLILQKYFVPIVYLTAYSDKATIERAKITSPYGYIVKPIEERDLNIAIEISLTKFEMEQKLRESEKKLSITLQSIGDGVIATDREGLISQMNRTAEMMCGWTLNEAKGYPLNHIFKIKSAITRNSIDNPVEEVFRTGKVAELANHTVLISRDGTERHISDSAAPILDEFNEIQGVVLVFSDVTESYKNRELLRQSEKLYREVIENASDIIYTTDKHGKFTHANTAALKFTGYSMEDIRLQNFVDLVHPDYKAMAKRHYFRQYLEKKTTTYTEIPIIKRNGEVSWFGQNVTLVTQDQKVNGFYVISRDITDRKNAEDALRKNEELLRLIIDIIPDRIFVKDVDGKFILNNLAHLRALDAKTQADTLGKTDFDFRSNERALNYQAQDRNVVEKELPLIDFQQHEIKEDGKEAWFLVSKMPLRTSDSKISGIVGIIKDITEQKISDNLLRESRRSFQTLANASPVGIFRTDATGFTTYVNPRWCEISGMNSEEAIGNGWLLAVHEKDKDRLKEEWYSAAKARRPSRADYRFIKPDGSISWVMGQAVPEINEENEAIGYVGTITDITERKMIEEALQESEEIFNRFMSHSPIYIYFKDEQGKSLRLSKNFEQLVGMSMSQMIGKSMYDLFHSDFAKKIIDDDLKVLRQGEQIEIEEELNGKYYTTIKFPIYREGKPSYLAGYTIDISQRKKAELEIRKLANALKSINECVSITTLDNKLTFVNQSLLNTYGFKEEELIGQNISILSSPNNPPGVAQQVIESTLISGWQGELLNRKKDGTEFPIHLSTTSITDDKNNPIALIGVASDISLRKQRESELRKLNQAVIQSPASIIITDINANIEYINPKVIETSGYTEAELISNNPRIFSSKNFSQKGYKKLWETISSGKEWRGEFNNKKKNGELYWEYASISSIKNESGIITHYIAIKEDVTERKRLELGLIEAKEKAERANELKDAFIANISHEIRTPLNGVLGMTSIIKDAFAEYITPKEEQFFAAIDRSSKRIIRTVDMILNFSRLQVGDFKSTPRIIYLNEVLNELYQEFSISARQKGLELLFENKIGEVKIQSDYYCLNQVVSNLLDNAIKYTQYGSIKIILYFNDDNRINIDVQDSGIGISKDYLGQIFNPYTQEEVGYTRSYDGVGLGLSLVKNFLTLINAEISVQSKKGEGSTFTITFAQPAYTSETEELDNLLDDSIVIEPAKNFIEGKIPTILVVEDEEINQLFLSVKLKKTFNTVIVDNATKALEALEKHQFDIILMDISLKGGLNGIELTKLLRETIEYKTIPIIAVTGHAFDQDRERCLAVGSNDYISKPFKIEELLEKINKYLFVK